MENIKQWALGLVLTSVIGTVVLVLSPSGPMERQVRLAVSLVLLIMLVRPLTGLLDIKDTGFENNGILKESTSYASDDYFIVAFKNELNNKLVELIENEGIDVIETEIDVSVNDAKEVAVEGVVVFIADTNEISTVKNLIKNEYGIIAEVEVSD